MAKQKAVKRRRAGGGRKPQGNFSRLRSVMSFRISAEMQNELIKAAREGGRSVTQELLNRLRWSFDEDRKNYRDPAIRALCFLFSELAESVHFGTPNWRSDPFCFRAFKIAVGKLLDALEPGGEIKTPRLLANLASSKVGQWLEPAVRSPEAMADRAVSTVLSAYGRDFAGRRNELRAREPGLRSLDSAIPDWPGYGSQILRQMENSMYGMETARRDLNLKPRGRK